MAWGKHNPQRLLVTSGVFQELAIELADDIEVVIDVDIRPNVIANSGDDFLENAIRILFCRLTVWLAKVWMDSNRRVWLQHRILLGLGDVGLVQLLLDCAKPSFLHVF